MTVLEFSCIRGPKTVPGAEKGLHKSLWSPGPAEAAGPLAPGPGRPTLVLSCLQALGQAGTSAESSACCPQAAGPHLGSSGPKGYWIQKCPLADSSPAPRARSLLQTHRVPHRAAIYQASSRVIIQYLGFSEPLQPDWSSWRTEAMSLICVSSAPRHNRCSTNAYGPMSPSRMDGGRGRCYWCLIHIPSWPRPPTPS